MSLKLLTLLLVVPAIRASIDIQIVATNDQADSSVTLAGNQVDIISDKERATFNIQDNSLKYAVNVAFGAEPDDVYVKSPTPWDLYETYGWSQITRTLTPVRATVLGVQTQPTIVTTQSFENNSSRPATFNAKISQEVSNTVSTTWTKGGELSVEQEINYGIEFEVVEAGGSTKFSFTSSWGESATKEQTVTVGSESGIEVNLEPHQKVIAELYATRGTMKVQVFYDATLSGDVATNYADTYEGHHFWALPINTVMEAVNLDRTKSSNQILDIGYYGDSKIVIRDAASNEVVNTIPVKTA